MTFEFYHEMLRKDAAFVLECRHFTEANLRRKDYAGAEGWRALERQTLQAMELAARLAIAALLREYPPEPVIVLTGSDIAEA
jgi:hypothetical protein